MQKRYKIILAIIIVLFLLISGVTAYMLFFRNIDDNSNNKSSVVNQIKDFEYTLDDRDSKLMQEEFHNLEEILNMEEIDYQEYAQVLSKLFVIDLYTINNKINKYDIGSLEYILESEKEKFKSIIIDSIYKTVLDNSNHKREQELPEVKSVEVESIVEDNYMKGDDLFPSYTVSIKWDYVRDLGYDKKANITLVKENNKIFVVEYHPVVEGEIIENEEL